MTYFSPLKYLEYAAPKEFLAPDTWTMQAFTAIHNKDSKITVESHGRLAFIKYRLNIATLPVFGALSDSAYSAVQVPRNICRLRIIDAFYEMNKCAQCFVIFLAALSLSPFFAYDPTNLHCLSSKWDAAAFEKELDAWASPWLLQLRGEAKKEILRVYRKKSSDLSLYGHNLSSLPPGLHRLSWLKTLNLAQNSFKTIQDGYFDNFAQLETLDLSYGSITSLSEKTFSKLNNLEELDLSGNKGLQIPDKLLDPLINVEKLSLKSLQLTQLPGTIFDKLTKLKELDLSYNNLSSLPAQWFSSSIAFSLESFKVTENKLLNDLPLSLGSITPLRSLYIYGTAIPESLRDRILELCAIRRQHNAQSVLPTQLQYWAQVSHYTIDWSSVLNLTDDNQKAEISNWLDKLAKTKDFKTQHQEQLAKIVCEMLLDVVKNPEFQSLFFSQIGSNLEGCPDRAAMALNEIFTSWKILLLPAETTLKEKLQLLERCAKTLALRNAIAVAIDQHQKANTDPNSRMEKRKVEAESVEIYLYYEMCLKNQLQLVSATEGMLYDEIGKRDWIDDQELVRITEATYLGQLFNLPIFEKLIGEDIGFQALKEAVSQKWQKKMDQLIFHKLTNVLVGEEHKPISKQEGEDKIDSPILPNETVDNESSYSPVKDQKPMTGKEREDKIKELEQYRKQEIAEMTTQWFKDNSA